MNPLLLSVLFLAASVASAQISVAKEKPGAKNGPAPHSNPSTSAPQPADDSKDSPAPPRNSEESSSRDTIIDISPPRDDHQRPMREDEIDLEDSSSDVNELKPWNPHKAEKSNEVGEFHLKRKNYQAALSRFREALEYKPRDARATYRLGETLEKLGQHQEALQRYEEYLKILKNGPFVEEARKGAERLKTRLASKS